MLKTELILSNTTSYFSGRIEAVFKNAKKYGFKYVEIVPYRWTTAEQILTLEKKYNIQVAGIHLPTTWKKSYLSAAIKAPSLFEKFASLLHHFYLGEAKSSPGWAIAKALHNRRPYVLFHTNVVMEMNEEFSRLSRTVHPVIENIPIQNGSMEFLWNPLKISEMGIGLVFDAGHFLQTIERNPTLNLLETYAKSKPEVLHISYNSRLVHILPNKKEQEELVQMLQIHQPKYITIETNPLVSIKKAKVLIEKIIAQALPA